MSTPQVAILMGSKTDLPTMQKAADTLKELGIAYEMKVLSAHRLPQHVAEYAQGAAGRGIKVLIGAAGMAAHLAGALAANSILPIIGVPLVSETTGLAGADALYSTVQMPRGMPVATVALNGAVNAAILAAQILGTNDAGLQKKLLERREAEAKKLLADQP